MAQPLLDVEDLDVWQRAMELAEAVYKTAKSLPADERYGISLQLRRAAVSVPSNIAEGYGRPTRPDYLKFLNIAASSNREIRTCIRVGLRTADDVSVALELSRRVGQMLTRLIISLRD